MNLEGIVKPQVNRLRKKKMLYSGVYLYLTVLSVAAHEDTAVCLRASRQQYLFDRFLLLYVQS